MKKLILIVLAAALTISLTASGAFAFSSLLNGVNTKCGTSYGCGLCHVDPGGGGPLTSAGTGYNNAGNDPCYFCPTVCAPPPVPVCTDADGDGFFKESGCGTAVDCNDSNNKVYPGAVEICNDKLDNDCDGKVDCADLDCANDLACAPAPTCTDSDGDGYFKQAGCGTSVDCNDSVGAINPGAVEACNDGIDNDCDGMIDCADSECKASLICAPAVTPENCSDGIDNDGDGKVDCADRDCRNDPNCAATGDRAREGRGKTCKDGIDNDGDGLVDCADPDCINNRACTQGSSNGTNMYNNEYEHDDDD